MIESELLYIWPLNEHSFLEFKKSIYPRIQVPNIFFWRISDQLKTILELIAIDAFYTRQPRFPFFSFHAEEYQPRRRSLDRPPNPRYPAMLPLRATANA